MRHCGHDLGHLYQTLVLTPQKSQSLCMDMSVLKGAAFTSSTWYSSLYAFEKNLIECVK